MKLKAKSYSLAIETSCDDTALAILEHRSPADHRVIADVRASQHRVHRPFGGVVPSLAAREHAKNLPLLLKKIFKQTKIKPRRLKHIAFTEKPGLAPCLLIGKITAQTLAKVWQKPLIPVNHVEAHALSGLMAPELKGRGFPLPAVALVASGGHTSLFLVGQRPNKNPELSRRVTYKLKLLGRTLDDAAGEAFDKVARLLGLNHPGGPNLEKLARKGDPAAFNFPRPMLKDAGFNFSFAGLKTSVLYKLKNLENAKPRTVSRSDSSARAADVAASFQQAVIDVLTEKTARAAEKYKAKTIILSGGVASNQALREAFKQRFKTQTLAIPPKHLCSDNAVMIAVAGAR